MVASRVISKCDEFITWRFEGVCVCEGMYGVCGVEFRLGGGGKGGN